MYCLQLLPYHNGGVEELHQRLMAYKVQTIYSLVL